MSTSDLIAAGQSVLPLMEQEERQKMLEKLAQLLLRKYDSENSWDDLETADDYLNDLIEDTGEDEYARVAQLSWLKSQCLQKRYMRGRNPTDLGNAIDFVERSISAESELTGDSNDEVPSLLERKSLLWLCLFTKIHQTDEWKDDDIHNLISVAQECLDYSVSNKADSELSVQAKSHLSQTYQLMWEKKKDFDDLAQALQLSHDAINSQTSQIGADAYISMYSNYAFQLQRAYVCFNDGGLFHAGTEATEGEQLAELAHDYLERSLSISGKRSRAALENLLTYLMYLTNYPKTEARHALGRCYDFLKKCCSDLKHLWATASSEDRDDDIQTFYGISRYAAAAAIESGEGPYEAIRILEEGRSIAFAAHMDEAGQREGWLSRETVLALAQDGPIVLVNITDIRSDAIIVRSDTIEPLHLPKLNETRVSEDSWELQTRLAQEVNQEEVFVELRSLTASFFRNLWKDLAKPVLDDLRYCRKPTADTDWPRMWWIPTGVLSLYPIHAAGHGINTDANVMSRVISSYTPTLTSLRLSRERRRQVERRDEFYPPQSLNTRAGERPRQVESYHASKPYPTQVLSMRNTPGRPNLDLAEAEAEVISKAMRVSQLVRQPDKSEVIQVLSEGGPVFHFSCHGEVDYSNPTGSKLLFSDWETDPFTVNDMQSTNVPEAQLAFLSACFTANAGIENQQDEAVHPVTGLLSAGFPNVVGSLWYVGQDAALAVVEKFYQKLWEGKEGDFGRLSAEALHFAVVEFRETTKTAGNNMKGNFVSWAPFVHYGA